VHVLKGEEQSLAAFDRTDGARIVTASDDNTARIWDAATGKEITILRGHDDRVQSAAFNPDGARIVTASVDKIARIWDVHLATMSTNNLVTEACRRRLRGLTTLTRDERRLAGYIDEVPAIDVCAGIEWAECRACDYPLRAKAKVSPPLFLQRMSPELAVRPEGAGALPRVFCATEAYGSPNIVAMVDRVLPSVIE
jgi:hypothetical protein